MIPVFKIYDRIHPSNYRPISLLLTISKVFEWCIFKKKINKQISDLSQNNFVNSIRISMKNSDLDAILKLTEVIYDAINLKQYPYRNKICRSHKCIWYCNSLYLAAKTRTIRHPGNGIKSHSQLLVQQASESQSWWSILWAKTYKNGNIPWIYMRTLANYTVRQRFILRDAKFDADLFHRRYNSFLTKIHFLTRF